MHFRTTWASAVVAGAILACNTQPTDVISSDTFAAGHGTRIAGATPLSAPDTVLGPLVLNRDSRAPQTDVREFSVRGFQGPYVLDVEQADSERPVAAAWVYLNGKEVPGPADFPSPRIHRIGVQLTEPSRLEIRVAAGPRGA